MLLFNLNLKLKSIFMYVTAMNLLKALNENEMTFLVGIPYTYALGPK